MRGGQRGGTENEERRESIGLQTSEVKKGGRSTIRIFKLVNWLCGRGLGAGARWKLAERTQS